MIQSKSDTKTEMLRRSIRANIADRPPDAPKEHWEIDIEKPLPHWPCRKCSKETAGRGNFYGMCWVCWQAQPGANRPPDPGPDVNVPIGPGAIAYDATIDPAEVAQLGRIQALADNCRRLQDIAREACADNERLRDQVKTLERHLERESQHKLGWRTECLLAERRFRRLILAAGAVIVILVAALSGAPWRLL